MKKRYFKRHIAWIIRESKKKNSYLFKKILRNLYEYYFLRNLYKLKKPKNPVKITEEDWDYLIILDACRYDFFKEVYSKYLKGKLEKKISIASNTEQWLEENFSGSKKEFIYVSGNPIPYTISEIKDSFFKLKNIWKDSWNNKYGTVMPKEITDASINLKRKYPFKKMIIHYMQPHAPYIGKKKITSSSKKNIYAVAEEVYDDVIYTKKITIPEIKKAYRENLKAVLKEVSRLVEHLDGKIVITADHGESFGEKNIFFHPKGIYIKPLIEVPWLVINKKNKKITDKIKI